MVEVFAAGDDGVQLLHLQFDNELFSSALRSTFF